VKDDREEKGTQLKSQRRESTPTMQASPNRADANSRGGEKKKVRPGKLSHSVTAGRRK